MYQNKKLFTSRDRKEARVDNQSYSPSFFANCVPGSLQSARVVLGTLFDVYRPHSVFDLGCGQGAWLAAAEELGCSRLVGVDGPWVNPKALLSNNIVFSQVDLEEEFAVPERFDLCISVEVAEHLSPSRAPAFVQTLCSVSDVVLFSAAIPLQGGVNHINEKWQSFWAEHFNALGYECHDLFRAKLWRDRRVESWYRQNVLLYAKSSHPLATEFRVKSQVQAPLDLVHPEIYEGNLEWYKKAIDEPTLRFCRQSFARWMKRQVKKIVG